MSQITNDTSAQVIIIFGSEYLLHLNFIIDLILLIINLIILNIPLIRHIILILIKKLSEIICTKKINNNKIQVKYVYKYKTKKKTNSESFNIKIDIDDPSSNITSSNSQQDNPQETNALIVGEEEYSTDEDSNSKNLKNRQNFLIEEVITQISYLLLLIAYVAYLFEILILRIGIRKRFLADYELKFQNIISIELISIVLIVITHLFQYGMYEQNLWLDSRVNFPGRLNRVTSASYDRCRFITLHSVAFTYFFLNMFGNGIKLIIIGILLKDHQDRMIILLRPYLSLVMVELQFYFAFKHLVQLIIFSNQINPINSDQSTASSRFSNDQIKYRRNKSRFLSMITFIWFIPILKLGYHKNLNMKDLGVLPNEEKSVTQFERFFQYYKSIDINKYKSTFLWRVCWRTYKKSLIFGAIIKIFSDLSSLVGPMSISYILDYISVAQNNSTLLNSTHWKAIYVTNKNQSLDYLCVQEFFNNAYVLTVIVLMATFLQSTLSNNFNHLVISEGIHFKSALSCCIYKKALTMPVNSAGIDAGVISNYMTVDSSNIFQFFTMMHYLWSVPIKITILLYFLYKQMGTSAICGTAIFLVLSPLQYYCSRQISIVQKLQLNISDKRVSKTTELFMGIKLLKLMGWELSFAEQVKKFRKTELNYLRRDAIFVAINTFITQASAILVTMVTFSLFTYIENKPLKAPTVFTSIALFNQITVLLYIVPLVISMLINAIISHRRLINYFKIRDICSNTIQWDQGPIRKNDIDAPNSAPILTKSGHRLLGRCKSVASKPLSPSPSINNFCCYIKNGKFAWYDEDVTSNECTLFDISVNIPRGKLTILVGSIGSGKSTLLASLIGETYLANGELHWLRENDIGFGYVPSIPWILNVSLQENITFGRAFDQKRYQEVIKACCLQADIDLLPQGDQTVIGERGITLSGGQRQRIALARAIYSSSATLILDDALSALDPIIGYSVFDNAIIRLAIKHQKRTVILATHKQEFLSRTDYVVVIESGTIKNQGTLEQVEKENKAFFYHRNVIKEKEMLERLEQKPGTCKTTEERHKLVRLLSKKGEFRGPLQLERKLSSFKGKPKKYLSRQVSYDLTNALPFHEWTELDDSMNEPESTISTSLTTLNKSSFRPTVERLASNDSYTSKHSHLSSINSFNEAINLNLIPSNQSNRSSLTVVEHQSAERLYSHISNYSHGIDSVIKEECVDGNQQELDYLSSELYDTFLDNDGSDDDSVKIEDATSEVTDELLHEIINFNENLIDGTLYNLDDDPRKNHISFDVFLVYFKAHSYDRATFVFILIVLNQTFRVVSDFWLANWADEDEHHSESPNYSISFYIQAYIILSIISVIISLATNLFAQLITIKAVRKLHDDLLSTLVRCPLRFFDKTPIGRIINRFTSDINVIDKKLPIAIPVLLRFLFLCISAIVVNIIICPYFLLAIIPILILYYYLQKIFRCTLRQLQRLESSSKSPIISHFNQTIDGLTTIRSFREQTMFTEKFFQHLDANNLCFLMVNSANCFLGIMLDYFGGIILFITMMISITAALYWNLHSAYVGLGMTYTLLVPVYLNWLVRNMAQVEMNMNSVERIYKYSQLEIEESCANSFKDYDRAIPEDWLKNGEIEFKNVTIRYGANLEPIIHDVNIHIKPGEKIGICGRTGSGKSSLIGALFRINEISSGKILIDGFDITHVCPYRLRKQLAIIPQDLVLFAGSIRDNLDPYREHSDEELWKMLKNFRLDRTITSLDEEIGDDSPISIEQRLSSGERQLLCCARAFLRNSPILFMDESTSLLDRKSELMVLEQMFNSQKTIIAIAHRVLNIVNFDKVAVVNEGRIVEFDTPHRLLSDTSSLFYSLYYKNSSYR